MTRKPSDRLETPGYLESHAINHGYPVVEENGHVHNDVEDKDQGETFERSLEKEKNTWNKQSLKSRFKPAGCSGRRAHKHSKRVTLWASFLPFFGELGPSTILLEMITCFFGLAQPPHAPKHAK